MSVCEVGIRKGPELPWLHFKKSHRSRAVENLVRKGSVCKAFLCHWECGDSCQGFRVILTPAPAEGLKYRLREPRHGQDSGSQKQQ